MAAFNKVILVGNLTRDPELRVTANGLSICKLGLAVSRNFTTKEGEKREETTFVDIDAFGKPGEILSKYTRKGRPLLVEGRLKLDQWETNEGQKRSKLGVVLENFQFLGGRDDSAQSGGGGYEETSPPPRSQANEAGSAKDFSSDDDTLDEDVPF
ncbi:MAG: single-stranded DNA-binding protein [Opitutales bacterium]